MNKGLRQTFVSIALVVIVASAITWGGYLAIGKSQPPIRVGILHSFTGTMAISEIPVAEAEQLAISEINASGGLLGGRKVEPILADGLFGLAHLCEAGRATFARGKGERGFWLLDLGEPENRAADF